MSILYEYYEYTFYKCNNYKIITKQLCVTNYTDIIYICYFNFSFSLLICSHVFLVI